MSSLMEAIKVSDPDELYNLAAISFVQTAFEQPVGVAEINGISVTKLLEGIRMYNPDIKFYQASTSEMYGNTTTEIQNEDTPFAPSSPYAAGKLYAHSMVDIYRKGYNIFAVAGILFNHEAPLRAIEFVSRKISNEVAKIHLGLSKKLVLGNIDAKRDWGYAPEYMEQVFSMLQQDRPEDFVISTGETHSVKEFAKLAFDQVGLDWEKYVKTDRKFFRAVDVDRLCGDSSKAKRILGWEPIVTFSKLVKIMVEEDIKKWKMCLEGKFFAWDAPLYPSEDKIIFRVNEKNTVNSNKSKR